MKLRILLILTTLVPAFFACALDYDDREDVEIHITGGEIKTYSGNDYIVFEGSNIEALSKLDDDPLFSVPGYTIGGYSSYYAGCKITPNVSTATITLTIGNKNAEGHEEVDGGYFYTDVDYYYSFTSSQSSTVTITNP